MLTVARPKQARSGVTREAFLQALERLLSADEFEAISIAQIAAEAGRSVGAFYTQFKDKEELLEGLSARYEEERGSSGKDFEPGQYVGKDLDFVVRDVVSRTVKEYRNRAGLFRALMQVRRKTPITDAGQRAQMAILYDSIASILLSKLDRDNKSAEKSVRLAFLMLISTCVSVILYPADVHPSTVKLSDKELIDECTRSMLAYLGAVAK